MADEVMNHDTLAPCGDGGCIMLTGPARGMHTNGGCRHFDHSSHGLRRLLRLVAADRRRLAEALAAERAKGALEMRARAAAVARERAERLTSLRPSHPATLETANELRDIALDIQDIEALGVEVKS